MGGSQGKVLMGRFNGRYSVLKISFGPKRDFSYHKRALLFEKYFEELEEGNNIQLDGV